MIFEILVIILMYIVIKDLQIIKADLIMINTSGQTNRKPMFNPSDMLSMFNNSLKALNDELKLNLTTIPTKHNIHIEVD